MFLEIANDWPMLVLGLGSCGLLILLAKLLPKEDFSLEAHESEENVHD